MAKLKPFNSDGVVERLSWEKPERKDQAGSLIIFGGSSFKLKEVDTIFKAAKHYGIGSVSALVPESLAKVFKRDDPYLIPVAQDNYFGLTDSGFKMLTEECIVADGLILADIGNNSSTGLKLAKLISNYLKPVLLTDSAMPLISSYATEILSNSNLVLLLNLQNTQKLIKASNLKLSFALNSDLATSKKIELLHEFQSQVAASIVLLDDERIISTNNSYYLNIKMQGSKQDLAAKIIAWKIWSPTTNLLEYVFVANTQSV